MRFATQKSVRNFSTLPGCNSACVSHGLFMKMEYRGKGHGKNEQRLSITEMKRLGYSYALCTVTGTNVRQLRILEAHGWHKLDTFHNKATGHTVELWGLSLGD